MRQHPGSGPNPVRLCFRLKQTTKCWIGAGGRFERHCGFCATYPQDRAGEAERMARQFQDDLASECLDAIGAKPGSGNRQVGELNRPCVRIRGGRMQQRSMVLCSRHALEGRFVRRTAGFHRFGLGIQVESDLQQHSRESHIVSGLSHFPSASGSLPEVGGVHTCLLFRKQNRHGYEPNAITTWRADRFAVGRSGIFLPDCRGGHRFLALTIPPEPPLCATS